MGKVVVIGSSNTDMVVSTDKAPAPGETVLGSGFFMAPGGKGARDSRRHVNFCDANPQGTRFSTESGAN